jgi:hypothetical protein
MAAAGMAVAVAVFVTSEIEKSNTHNHTRISDQAAEVKRVHHQLTSPEPCQNDILVLKAGDVYLSMPDKLNTIGFFPFTSSGDELRVPNGEDLVIGRAPQSEIGGHNLDSFEIVKHIGSKVFAGANSLPNNAEYVAGREFWVDYSTYKQPGNKTETQTIYSSQNPNQSTTTCDFSPTHHGFYTTSGEPAGYAYFVNASTFGNDEFTFTH